MYEMFQLSRKIYNLLLQITQQLYFIEIKKINFHGQKYHKTKTSDDEPFRKWPNQSLEAFKPKKCMTTYERNINSLCTCNNANIQRLTFNKVYMHCCFFFDMNFN